MFCIKKGCDLLTVKVLLSPLVVYATDRSKAVVLVLFLFCVYLWFLLRDVSCCLACSLSSCVCVCVCVCVVVVVVVVVVCVCFQSF